MDAKAGSAGTAAAAEKQATPRRGARREIPAGLSYVTTPGLLKRVLDKIIEAPAPDKLTQDYLGTVWSFTGGSAKAIIPLLKRLNFLGPDGKPTETYHRFRSEQNRNRAVREALHAGFSDLFKRNEHVEFASEKAVTDLVVEITGRERTDGTVRCIVGTFRTVASFLDPTREEERAPAVQITSPDDAHPPLRRNGDGLNIAYNINLILPETRDVEVFDAIFRSLNQHLLR